MYRIIASGDMNNLERILNGESIINVYANVECKVDVEPTAADLLDAEFLDFLRGVLEDAQDDGVAA